MAEVMVGRPAGTVLSPRSDKSFPLCPPHRSSLSELPPFPRRDAVPPAGGAPSLTVLTTSPSLHAVSLPQSHQLHGVWLKHGGRDRTHCPGEGSVARQLPRPRANLMEGTSSVGRLAQSVVRERAWEAERGQAFFRRRAERRGLISRM